MEGHGLTHSYRRGQPLAAIRTTYHLGSEPWRYGRI
jgi:hypothetical protein